jgi:hypothetical protein
LLAGAVLAFAAPKVEFSGRWKLVVEKSDFGNASRPVHMTVVCTVKGNVMHAVQTTETSSEGTETSEFTWYLDGKRHPTEKPFPGYSITKWEDDTLVNQRQSNDGAYKETIRVTVAANGKTAVEEITSKNPNGSNHEKLVWEKQ